MKKRLTFLLTCLLPFSAFADSTDGYAIFFYFFIFIIALSLLALISGVVYFVKPNKKSFTLPLVIATVSFSLNYLVILVASEILGIINNALILSNLLVFGLILIKTFKTIPLKLIWHIAFISLISLMISNIYELIDIQQLHYMHFLRFVAIMLSSYWYITQKVDQNSKANHLKTAKDVLIIQTISFVIVTAYFIIPEIRLDYPFEIITPDFGIYMIKKFLRQIIVAAVAAFIAFKFGPKRILN